MFSFTNKKKQQQQQQHSNKKTEADDMSSRRPRPRLDRRNANKNIDYDAITSSASTSLPHPPSPSSPDYQVRATRSLDLSPNIYSNQTSFRIAGSIDGEVDLICRSLGLSGPEDFAISASAWEASRARSRLSTTHPDPDPTPIPPPIPPNQDSVVAVRVREEGGIKGVRPPTLTTPEAMSMSIEMRSAPPTVSVSVPPPMMKTNPSPSSVLSPPPSISLPEIEKVGSTWDLVMAFAPEEEGERRRFKDYDDEEEKEEVRVKLGEETSEDVDITSTSNDDDSSSSTTEAMFVISPNGRFKRNIKSWMKGQMLGSGSFGTVYEGISE